MGRQRRTTVAGKNFMFSSFNNKRSSLTRGAAFFILRRSANGAKQELIFYNICCSKRLRRNALILN